MILDDKKIKKVHMTGIDGISMSGLAEILIDLGYIVSGSDLNYSERLKALEKKGATIFRGHDADNIFSQDIVVHTAAVKDDNPEMIKAKTLGIKRIDRSILLGEIMNKYKEKIAVSGTHGKSTTTSMLSAILLEAGKNPTIHIGAEYPKINGTTYIGGNDFFITESCEYTETYLKLCPGFIVITNIEFDHGDYFKDIDHVKKSFTQFINLLPENGKCVLNMDDKYTTEILPDLETDNICFYSLEDKEAHVYGEILDINELGCYEIDVSVNKNKAFRLRLSVPGKYNVYNALAGIASGYKLGIPFDTIKKALEEYKGIARRFEFKGEKNGIKVIDDYAHHPSEIKSVLGVFKKRKNTTLWCVFQSHTYTRTKLLLDDFSTSFDNADKIIITDIYAAREKDTGEVSGSILAERIKKTGKDAIYLSGFKNIAIYLKEHTKPGDIILTMGAGDAYLAGEIFLEI
jgi:UDP-N-acetylmuramate--alanine ligase